MTLRREIKEGGYYPGFWYGVAWDEWREGVNGCVVVCYPIPLNWIFGMAHAIYLRLRTGGSLRSWRGSYLCRKCRDVNIYDDWKKP